MKDRHYFDKIDDHELALDPVNKKLGGVCSGIARYLDIPSIIVRLGAIIGLCVLPQATLLAYGLAYVILNPRP
ncbi:MAG: PspC domain-containing protein [Proteobacteria bacterium]|nr:PspC domain-containing protein [Pseudomonadota bacterium]